MNNETVVIIGAGPAGLSAAHELLQHGVRPIVFEKAEKVGGISRSENFNGYLFDIGGHRFFSKSKKINQLWQETLGENLLKVPRISHIYYNDRFFKYPLHLFNALSNLGIIESFKILISYIKAQIKPFPDEDTFEQWMSNRFGSHLYKTFFETYTEKVWGVPCDQIKADWAAQRINNMSLIGTIYNALFGVQSSKSLIDEFYYPQKGAGMMWQELQKSIESEGGQVLLNSEVTGLSYDNGCITNLTYTQDGNEKKIPIKHIISSTPISHLVSLLNPAVPEKVIEAAGKLSYRAFIIVTLIINKEQLFPDQWIYIHEPGVSVSRIQNFKNWSKAMVPDPDKSLIGMEYFCNENDEIWKMADPELIHFASQELSDLKLTVSGDVIDGRVVRQPKAYPVYNHEYTMHLHTIREFLKSIENLQTIGRNGMYRYNNMDHSMLTGILSAQNIMGSNHDLWAVNEEQEYIEIDKAIKADSVFSEKIIKQTFARMDKFAIATAIGTVSGLLMFLATLWLVIKGGEVVGPNLKLLNQYFLGYTVTVKGAFIALGYSFFWGFLFGWLFAYLRNFSLAFYLFWLKKKTELLSIKDFFDLL